MKKLAVLVLALAASVTSFAAEASHPSVFIEAQNGFETYIAAAFEKKHVPMDVVTDQSKATFVLKAAPVEIKQESTGGKIARCLFAYCAGIEDKGNVSVQLIDQTSTRWYGPTLSTSKEEEARTSNPWPKPSPNT
ncbi:MAG: hypothetical protein ACRD2U_18110 [Terriglobales bacterium]